jgi:signal transduction histidine kinase
MSRFPVMKTFSFSKLNLLHRFLLTGILVLLAGMAVIGTWVSKEIEKGVISGTGVVTSIYLHGAISHHLQSLAGGGRINDADRIALDRELAGTHFGERAVALRVWARDGRIVYSSANPLLVGRKFPVTTPLVAAFAGEVRTQVAKQSDLEIELGAKRSSRLIETYAPIRDDNDGSIIVVAELYQTADDLEQDMRAAQWRIWGIQAVVTLAILALFTALVKRANNTIVVQQRELQEKVVQLSALLAQNEQLHDRVSRAAARTMALNEQFLRNIARDLHDGPGQGLALASMRIEALADVCGNCEHSVGRNGNVSEDFRTIHLALQSALTDLRAILRGLQLPEIEQLSLAETLQRAADDHQRKTGVGVPLTLSNAPATAPLPVRITLFRVLQESLANGFRHGGGRGQRVAVTGSAGHVSVEVADDGKGFDPNALKPDGHFGLDWMRERVELLGGSFEVRSAIGRGTVVRVSLPLWQLERIDG